MKKRIIPVVFALDGYLVRSEAFSWHQRLGNLTAQVERYSEWNLDELVYIDIGATRAQQLYDQTYFVNNVSKVAEVCRMPLTFGGGILTERHAGNLFRYGADKVVISTGALVNPTLVRDLSRVFGSQAICVSLDITCIGERYVLTSSAGRELHYDVPIHDHIKRCEDYGCGEFFLNAVHRDGLAGGFDIQLIRDVTSHTSVPVIVCGGANSTKHFSEAIESTSASAFAAGNFFNFRELSYPILKSQLYKKYPSILRSP